MSNTSLDKVQGWAPIYSKGLNRFVILRDTEIFERDTDAQQRGLSVTTVEGVLYGFDYTGKTMQIKKLFPHVKATLGSGHNNPLPIALIAGPIFDSKKKEE